MVELEDGEQEVEREGGVGFELFVEGEGDALVVWLELDEGDGGAVEEAAGDEVEGLAGFGAEDAAEVERLRAEQIGGGGGSIPAVGDEAAAGHLALEDI